VRAFGGTRRRLVIIGQGERLPHLKKIATPNIEFLGYQPDDVVRDHYARCRALVFPGEEDFGLTPVEAQACGRPVVAYAAGGSLETVIEGETGVFFRAHTPESLPEAVDRFERLEFDPAVIRSHAERFDIEGFALRIRAFVEAKRDEYEATFFR
jgi:glycosyltransferase involved in cell wall biosynthesis